jgi:hypothetical protein
MNLGRSARGILLGVGTIVVATGASVGVDLPSSFVPRCQTDELRLQPGTSDPCQEEFAVLGLSGPTVLTHSGAEVEATGSIKAAPDSNRKRTD